MKTVSAATRALLDDMREDSKPSDDRLDVLRTEIAKLRDQEYEISELEARLTELKSVVKETKEKTLVEMFDEAGVNRLGIDAAGNLPAYEIEINDRYHANIPDEVEGEAFEYLQQTGHADLIKTVFTIQFGLKEAKATERFQRSLDKAGIVYSARKWVPWNTLTAWFKTEYKRKPLPAKAMELLGASIGRVAKVVKQREKK